MIGRQKTYSVQLTEQEKRLIQQQVIAPSEVLENFPDIDECLEARARAVIELAGAIRLKEAADKAEERERQRREALEKGEAIASRVENDGIGLKDYGGGEGWRSRDSIL